MRIDIRYITRFRYSSPVWDSHNVLRAAPRDEERQTLRNYRVEIDPVSRIHSHTDMWGTRVDSFGIRQAHDQLLVVAEATVETHPQDLSGDAALDSIDDEVRASNWLFLQGTEHVALTRTLSDVAATVRQKAGSVRDLIDLLCQEVHGHIAYRPGTTEIGVDVDQVWSTAEGVCQDFAHVTISLLRSLGVPARYVSGYLYAADASDGVFSPEGESIVVQTHAWVEALVPGVGWWALDPTNAQEVGERHVVIGRGRDYDDVTPLRGVYHGQAEADLAAEVTMMTGGLGPVVLPTVELSNLHAAQQ